jgi:hypothetical protein
MAFDGFHARATLANHAEPIDATYSGLSHEGAVFSTAQNRVQRISNPFGHVYQRASALGS